MAKVAELTAAGQFRIFTGFPFNPGLTARKPKLHKCINFWMIYVRKKMSVKGGAGLVDIIPVFITQFRTVVVGEGFPRR